MAFPLLLLAMAGAQSATGSMSVGATVVRYEATARPTVAVERGAVRIANAASAVVTTERAGDRIIVTLTY
jgi:RNase P/RNase MRP subunit POP5